MLPIKLILHPTDFSGNSENAFHLACSLARDHGARLVVVHVAEPPVTILGGMPAVPPLPEEYAREALLAQLHRLQAPGLPYPVEHRLVEGEAVTEILNLARVLPCDLIVMGTHGRRGLGRLLMGSVAEQVVRKAPCPVLTVRRPAPAAAQAEEPIKSAQQRANREHAPIQ